MFDRLYLTLKTIEDTNWFGHMDNVMSILQSSAFTMVWQRAHWRHPDTPAPTLQALIEVFQDWQCCDLRDNVYALVDMANRDTAITPDYFRSPAQIYCEVMRGELRNGKYFRELLAQLLALPGREIGLDQPDLYVSKGFPFFSRRQVQLESWRKFRTDDIPQDRIQGPLCRLSCLAEHDALRLRSGFMSRQ